MLQFSHLHISRHVHLFVSFYLLLKKFTLLSDRVFFVEIFIKAGTAAVKAVVESISSYNEVIIGLLQPDFGYW